MGSDKKFRFVDVPKVRKGGGQDRGSHNFTYDVNNTNIKQYGTTRRTRKV